MDSKGGKMLRLHTSDLTTLIEMCPLQYYYKKIEGIKTPPNAAIIRGVAVHMGCRANFAFKLETGDDLLAGQLTTIVADSFDKLAKGMTVTNWSEGSWREDFAPEDIKWGDNDSGKSKDDAISIIKAWHEVIFSNYTPYGVEEQFEIPYDADGFTIGGTWDFRGATKHIDNILLDWKTADKSWDASRCHKEYSPTVYSLGHLAVFGKLPAGFIFEVAAVLKSGVKMESHLTKRSAEQVNRFFLYVIQPAFRMITAGIFPAALAGWVCSDKFCGYHADICQAVKGAKSFVV